MASKHVKLLKMSGSSFKSLCQNIKNHEFQPGSRTDGFVIQQQSPNRLDGRFYYFKTQKIATTNAKSLQPETIETRVLLGCNFSIQRTQGTISCEERRSDLAALEEQFNGIEGVQCEMEDLCSDVVEIYRAIRQTYGKTDLKSLRIKDYLGREGLLTTANFKLMEPAAQDQILKSLNDQIQAFACVVTSNDSRGTISVTRNGSIRYSDTLAPDVLEMALTLYPQFHDEVAVEVAMA